MRSYAVSRTLVASVKIGSRSVDSGVTEMASTILFVHGTGVRSVAYERTLSVIRTKVAAFLPRYAVEGCLWGDAFGSRLNARGVTVPGYKDWGAASAAIEDSSRALWAILAEDPLLELRVTTLDKVLGAPQGPAMLKAIQSLETDVVLLEILAPLGLAESWPRVINTLSADPLWTETIRTKEGSVGQISPLAARAVVAEFLRDSSKSGYPGITGEQRDELVKRAISVLGAALGLGDWLKNKLTSVGVSRRGSFTDLCSAQLGDILRYQARGETLRKFIGERAARTEANVILAHSLGGVAAVDWLISGSRSVDVLVTVGSQSPLFYEIDALSTLAFGQPLPEHFPRKWINFYDTRDFLAYRGQDMFPGIARDVCVDNGQPFPDSHSAYWQNDAEVWSEMARFLP